MTADRGGAAPVLVLALSARWMAEALVRVGHRVLACDLFGDADTRATAQAWAPAGDPVGLALDLAHCRRSLQDLVASSRQMPLGWLAGPGCEPLLAELQPFMEGLGVPLIGNDAATVDAVRDPQRFFAVLDAHGLAHPPVSWEAVAPIAKTGDGTRDGPAERWLSKDAWGSGGWHVALGAEPVSATHPQGPARRYWQRCESGQPVSLLFLADGHEVVPLAWQRQVVAPHGQAPFAWQGVQGPLQLASAMQAEGLRAARILTRTFGLCGLNSLDGLWVAADASDPVCGPLAPFDRPVSTDLASREAPSEAAGGTLLWLELNPRCSASMALYPDWPLMRWHLQACAAHAAQQTAASHGKAEATLVSAPTDVSAGSGQALPDGLAEARTARSLASAACEGSFAWRGTRIVWADREAWVSRAALAAARAQAECHDLPSEPCRVFREMPLVTVSATASTEAGLNLRLAALAHRARQQLLGEGDGDADECDADAGGAGDCDARSDVASGSGDDAQTLSPVPAALGPGGIARVQPSTSPGKAAGTLPGAPPLFSSLEFSA